MKLFKGIKGLSKSNFAENKKELYLPGDDQKQVKLFVRELGYAEVANIASQENFMAHMVQLSVTDEQGNHFTMDEIMTLRREAAEALFKAVADVNAMGTSGGTEKN